MLGLFAGCFFYLVAFLSATKTAEEAAAAAIIISGTSSTSGSSIQNFDGFDECTVHTIL